MREPAARDTQMFEVCREEGEKEPGSEGGKGDDVWKQPVAEVDCAERNQDQP